MNRTLIVTGGTLSLSFLQETIEKYSFTTILAVDRGLEKLIQSSIVPHHMLGDFDSVSPTFLEECKQNPNILFHPYPPEKDFTDTELAIQLAISLDSDEIYLLGALGTRMDHTLANLHILKQVLPYGIPCKILEEHNQIELLQKEKFFSKETIFGDYISLLPLTETVTGITLKGFKYPLTNATMELGKGIGVSNEILEEDASITISSGIVIVIQSRD